MTHAKRTHMYLAVALAAAVPVLIWAASSPFGSRWQDLASTLLSFGQLTGIVGLVLFCATFLFSARFGWMERLLAPLNEMYVVHQELGKWSFLLLLLHPIALILSHLLAGTPNVARLIVPGLDADNTWGILSLWLMVALLVLTLYLKPKYNLWKRTHQFLGLALFLGGIHGLVIDSDISRVLPLQVYLLGLCSLSLGLFVAYTLLNRLTVPRAPYRVAQIERLSDAVIQTTLTPAGRETVEPHAGQFVFVQFRLPRGWSEPHPFSVSGIGQGGALSVSFKALGDDTQAFVDTLKEGAEARIEGPFGAFGDAAAGAARAIYVAGGIGVTPFLSMAGALAPEQHADLYYCVKNKAEAAHLPALNRLAEASEGRLRVLPWFSDQQGYLTADTIAKTSERREGDQYLLCGPVPMMRALRKQLAAMGAPPDAVHSEEFAF